MNKSRWDVITKRDLFDVIILIILFSCVLCYTAISKGDVLMDNASDSWSYISVAENLVKGNGFTNAEGNPDGFRTPGYPFFLAVIFWLGGSIGTVIAVQIGLAALCIYLAYAICRMMGIKHKFAFGGATILAADFMTGIYTCYILSDAYFVYFLVIAGFFLAKYLVNKKDRYFCLFVIALNYALLIRPILMYFNMLLCVAVMILWLVKRMSLRNSLFAILVFSIVFFGWSSRNYLKNGVFEMSSVRNYNMFEYDGAMLRSRVEKISLEDAREKMHKDFAEENGENELMGLSKSELRRLQAKFGRAYIREHFGQYLLMNIEGLISTMIGLDRGRIVRVVQTPFLSTIISIVYFVYLCLIYVAYLVGWLANFRKADVFDFYILTISGYCAVASASVGYPRFRVAFFALIIIGMISIWNKADAKGLLYNFCQKWKIKK